MEAELLTNAFLHCEDRKVDKSGCISFMGKKYEAGLTFIGNTVQVIYGPADITEITIEHEGHAPWKARELTIGERSGKRPMLPDHLQAEPAYSSRLLRAAEQKHEQRKEENMIHCGEWFDLSFGEASVPCRIELDRQWYVVMQGMRFYLHPKEKYKVEL